VRAITSLSFRPAAVTTGVALLSLIVPPLSSRSFGQAIPKVSVDALAPPLPSASVDRDVTRSAHHAEAYGTPQSVTPPAAPPPVVGATPTVAPVYAATPQVPVVVSPSPTPVMIQPGPTTVLIGQTPPPNIIFAGGPPPAQNALNLMMLSSPQSPPLVATPSPQGTTTSASVQCLMPQPLAQPQPQQPTVSAVVLRRPGPICSTLGAIGRSLAKLGQPTVELSPPPLTAQVISVPAPQHLQPAAPTAQAPPSPPVAAEPPRPSPQSDPSHRWKWFRH